MKTKSEFKKVLFFKLGAIGDTLMTTPLVRQVRKNFKNVQIDYLIGKTSAPVLENNSNISNIITFDEMIFVKKKIFEWIKLIKLIKEKKYDLIFVLDKHRIFNLTAKLFRIKRRVGFDRLGKEGIFLTDKVYYGKIRHEIYCYLDLAKEIGLKVNYKDTKMDIFLSDKDKRFANEFWKKHKLNDKKVIAVCPGGSKNYADSRMIKRIPLNVLIKVIKSLIIKKIKVVLIGGQTDKELEEDLLEKGLSKNKKDNLKNTKEYVVSAIGKITLKQSAAILEKCNIVICNDSGPMHLAASVNKNIIAIFGPTNPTKFAPLLKQSKYVWKSDLYDPKEELFGKYKKKDYFVNLKSEEIIKLI